jgi:hypothetical protein
MKTVGQDKLKTRTNLRMNGENYPQIGKIWYNSIGEFPLWITAVRMAVNP